MKDSPEQIAGWRALLEKYFDKKMKFTVQCAARDCDRKRFNVLYHFDTLANGKDGAEQAFLRVLAAADFDMDIMDINEYEPKVYE